MYKPVRELTGTKWTATLAAFLVSGLEHEHVWQLVFYVASFQEGQDPYIPSLGKSLLFFGWNELLLVAENGLVGKDKWEAWIEPYPKVSVSLCVVLMALPVGHFFTGDLVEKGFMADLSTAFLLVRIHS